MYVTSPSTYVDFHLDQGGNDEGDSGEDHSEAHSSERTAANEKVLINKENSSSDLNKMKLKHFS